VPVAASLLERVDDLTDDRDDFIREAVEDKVETHQAQWEIRVDTLSGTAGLEITIPKAPEKVKPISELS